ncbi:MAG TPA: exodeoxyribonuclease VII large subunit [Blastocatellia bacterium]|nr:exodeoxyribonuclease VII large subunit [Blastocatellia bacterium]
MPSQISMLDSLLEAPKPLTVTELTAEIKQILERRFAEVWIEGEISNFKRHSSGHWYFTLKDEGAQVRCASFRNSNRYIRFEPEDGLKVRVRGKLSLYEPRGEYQIIVTSIEPVGIGALQLAFEQLKERLEHEGLFDADRKRPIPMLPRTVGIVTSPTGAALRDMLRVLGRRNRSVSVLIAPTRVQGEGAAREIAAAIEMLSSSGRVDVIIAGRGGGSLEDLWSFNEEIVARAIAASVVPVISAVGHETDFTIADFVADLRAPTPSAAAELVAASADELFEGIRRRRQASLDAVRYRVLHARSSVRSLRHSESIAAVPNRVARMMQETDDAREFIVESARAALRSSLSAAEVAGRAIRTFDPRRRILAETARLAALNGLMASGTSAALERRRLDLGRLVGALSSLSPLDVLARGYAVVRSSDGAIVRSVEQVGSGDRISVRVADGTFDAVRDDSA